MPKKILIAEDEAEILKMFSDMFEAQDFQVFRAADGEQALAAIKDYQPDLLLLDLQMPKMDGFDVLTNLQENGRPPGMKIVVLTNLDKQEWIEKAKTLGADDYWLKIDVHLTELLAKVKKLFSE